MGTLSVYRGQRHASLYIASMKSVQFRLGQMRAADWGYGLVATASFIAAVASRLMGAQPHPEMLSDTTISSRMHLLSADLLRHDLWHSLLNLHSAPPLFNLETAVLMHLSFRNSIAWSFAILCATLTSVATYGLLRFFEVPRLIAASAVIVFICLDPARTLFGNYYSYDEATAALVTVSAWLSCLWVRQRRDVYLRLLWWAIAILTLYNSNQSIYVLVLALSPALWAMRSEWRRILRVGIVPLLLVSFWYANDLVRFHQPTTSSWLGSNLARNSLMLAPTDDLHALVKQKVLGPIALIRPFDYPRAYTKLVTPRLTGVPARDQKMDLRGAFPAANFNWDGYRNVSSLYLQNDVAWIVHRPLSYLRNVARTTFFWSLPSSQFYLVEVTPGYALSGYTEWYSRLIEWQLQPDHNAAGFLVVFHQYPHLANISWLAVLQTLMAILVFPILLLRRRTHRSLVATALVPWLFLVSSYVTTSLIEVSENNRFRFEAGGLPLTLTVIALVWFIQDVGAWRASRRSRSTALSAG